MKDVLRILQWRRGPDRWVLKCPQHMEQLPVLNRVFPDATLVFTHRDPVAVITSSVTMLAYTQRINRRCVQLAELIAYWTDRIERLLRAYVAQRERIPAARSVDVPFQVFMADPMAMVERIYARAALPMTPTARAQIERYIDDHPRGGDGQVLYDLRRDFGVDPDDLRGRFAFYREWAARETLIYR